MYLVWCVSGRTCSMRSVIPLPFSMTKVDFVKLAEAMGAKAFRASTREEFVQIFEKARGLNEPVLIDCQIDCDAKSMADGCSRSGD